LVLLTIGPLLLESWLLQFRPARILPPYASPVATAWGVTLVLLAMVLALAIRAWLDRAWEPHATRHVVLFAIFAAILTFLHWLEVDRQSQNLEWQGQLYEGLLNHEYEAPHNYRPLPYGFVRLIEWITHQWVFACLSYRWFFTFWFLWASYRLARRYLNPSRALVTLLPLVLLYPLSIFHYQGQLTDPVSHTLFVLAFLYLLEDRPLALAAALALGIMAKETVVLVAPAYLACYWRRGWRSWFITAGLGSACLAAFLAVRLPLGWWPGGENLNGVGLVVWPNLGYEHPRALLTVPLWVNLGHPVLFVVPFVPFIVWRWRHIPSHLRALFLVVTPLLLLSNICFGWLYESRNYMPLVPLLATMAMPPVRRATQVEVEELQRVGT
jgi:hypothetical protein